MTNPDTIWIEALRTLERGKPFALATVVNVRGSTPREVGAKMIVRDNGQFGTIGGGCGEAEVFRKARVLLEEKTEARLTEVDLTGDFEQDEVGTCGGIMDVFIDLWSPEADLAIARKLAEAATHSRPAALVTVVDPGAKGVHPSAHAVIEPERRDPAALMAIGLPAEALPQMAERAADSHPGLLAVGEAGALKYTTRIEPAGVMRVFVDPISGAQRLIIAGAGGISCGRWQHQVQRPAEGKRRGVSGKRPRVGGIGVSARQNDRTDRSAGRASACGGTRLRNLRYGAHLPYESADSEGSKRNSRSRLSELVAHTSASD